MTAANSSGVVFTHESSASSSAFGSPPAMEPSGGWQGHNADRVVEGPAWGGCLEVLAQLLMADREIRYGGLVRVDGPARRITVTY
ncbi:hypothetical protein [Streptacidiphilus sp. P02-A3a]|uniref:hypothetical protein n=1 Tax=Streptacidiphilus sp. P02-A3a TaxID=2704468 RepID=UPI0015FBBDCF|nr:hypothetical protein [Streptacidiphilus sp. P02-A3a]